METIETKNGLTLKLIQDESPQNPRTEFENLGTMACFHRRYDLGDTKHGLSIPEVKDISKSTKYFSLPLYLYDHSGLTISTSPFSCPWDSGQIGVIFVSKAKVRKEWSIKHISEKLRVKVMECLRAEVETYDQYLTGDTWGYVIEDKNGNHIESCFGFYGSEYVKKEGLGVLNYLAEKQLELPGIPA